MDQFFPIIPAGGPGSRLWPLSRQHRPKFLLDILGTGRSLIQETWVRLSAVAHPSHMSVITGAHLTAAVQEQLPELAVSNVFVEPSPRDTAAAISLTVAVNHQRNPKAIVGSFPADQVLAKPEVFPGAMQKSLMAAAAGDKIVTVGVPPAYASTALGYIHVGPEYDGGAIDDTYIINEFVEKPDFETAARYLDEKKWLWNTGMFVFRADSFLDALQANAPDLFAGVTEIAREWDGPQQESTLNAVWPELRKISIDYAVMEPAARAGRMLVVSADLGWDDIGDWASLVNLLSTDQPTDVVVIGDPSQATVADSTGLVVPQGGRRVCVYGVDDIVVIDTPDVLLVTTKRHSQGVRKIVENLRNSGHDELI